MTLINSIEVKLSIVENYLIISHAYRESFFEDLSSISKLTEWRRKALSKYFVSEIIFSAFSSTIFSCYIKNFAFLPN